jgi:hypothetical protein
MVANDVNLVKLLLAAEIRVVVVAKGKVNAFKPRGQEPFPFDGVMGGRYHESLSRIITNREKRRNLPVQIQRERHPSKAIVVLVKNDDNLDIWVIFLHLIDAHVEFLDQTHLNAFALRRNQLVLHLLEKNWHRTADDHSFALRSQAGSNQDVDPTLAGTRRKLKKTDSLV